jgi:hypothetical protein
MRQRRSLLAITLLLTGASTLPAQAALRAAPSGRALTEVTLSYPEDSTPPGFTPMTIRVEYGQPHLRGRALHTDSLVPYDRPWRTGANSPTLLSTGIDLEIGGKALPRGSYVLWTLPSRSGWTLIVQKPPAASEEGTYNQANDLHRIPLKLQTVATPIESLTMTLIPSRAAGKPRGELRIGWGTSLLSTEWVVR